MPAAVRALEGAGLSVWLAGMALRPPTGRLSLRLVRLLVAGAGTWDEAKDAFRARWWEAEQGEIIGRRGDKLPRTRGRRVIQT